MKFTDGQWLTKPGYSFLYATQVFDAKFIDDELTVFIYTKPADSRAQTIDQGTITLHFTTDLEDTIHIRAAHYEGVRRKFPQFEITKTPVTPQFQHDKNSLTYTSGKLCAVINKKPFFIIYYYNGKKLTESVPRALANITSSNGEPFMRDQLSLSAGEYVYGLGERFTAFTKNGQNVEMWNEDGGTASELTYKNIPFYITSNQYGVFVLHPEKVSYEVASENVERVQFSVPGQQLEYIVIGGNSTKQVVCNYTSLTGKPALPPAWSFGLWLTTSFTTSYDEKTVSSFIDGMKNRNIPLHVFHFDCFWMSECQWCNFEWDPITFPEPKEMLARLKAKGLKICVWINPYIAQKSPLFEEGMKKHYLIEKPDGDVWQWDRWQAGMGIIDFTNPDAYIWYQKKLKQLLDIGVDCFKTDFGERIPTDVVYYDKSDAIKMHNYYTYLYNKCVFELLEKEKGKNNAVLFARSATVGSQKFPVHWGGDCWGTYESMAESLRGGLSLCMSGFGFWSHDISGFEKTATPDLYKRWVAFGLLSTHSRLHGSSSYRVPWLFDEEAVDVLRHFTNLRCSLMPYIWTQANITARTGCPMMRSMVLEFSEVACKFLDMQYMLGEALLVAPVFNNEGNVNFYLPEGQWVDYFTGEVVQGGHYYEKHCDYFTIPLYQRQETIVAIGKSHEDVEYDYLDGVTFRVSPIADEKSVFADVISSDGTKNGTISVSKKGQKLTVQVQGIKNYSVEFFGMKVKFCSEGYVRKEELNNSYTVTSNGAKTFTVELL